MRPGTIVPVGEGLAPPAISQPARGFASVGDGVLDVPLYIPHPGTSVSVGEGLAPPAISQPAHGFAFVGDGVLDVPLYVPHPGTPVSVGEGLAPPAISQPAHGFASVGDGVLDVPFLQPSSMSAGGRGRPPLRRNDRSRTRRGRRPRRPVSPTFIHVRGRPRAAAPTTERPVSHPVGDGVLDVPLYVPHPGTPVSVGAIHESPLRR